MAALDCAATLPDAEDLSVVRVGVTVKAGEIVATSDSEIRGLISAGSAYELPYIWTSDRGSVTPSSFGGTVM